MSSKSNFIKLLLFLLALITVQVIAVVSPIVFDKGIPNYLGWHNLMELASIVISIMVFAVAWNNKNTKVSSMTVFLGCSFLLVGIFDLLHTLSYNGMPDFMTPNGWEKHLTFWLMARVMAAVALFVAAIKNWGPLIDYTVLSYISYFNTVVVALFASFVVIYHPEIFPVWFIPGQGLTDIKKEIEYFVIVLHLIAALLYYRRLRNEKDNLTVLLLLGATTILGVGEVFFTLYTTMIGGYNVLGHIYKVVGYMFIFRALVTQAFDEPYQELKDSHIRISQLVNYDELTGIPNKQLFRERVEQAIKLAERTDQDFAMFFLDLDNFKNVNDTMGHLVGDTLLREVSGRLQSTIRDHDTVARVGGDEFVLLIQNVNHSGAAIVAKNIIGAMANPFTVSGNNILTSTSIGIAIYKNDGTNFETLYQHADTAMYDAKNKGKNDYSFFTQDVQDKIERTITIESQLRTAVDNNEFSLYYQPQISLITNELVGAEALIRWNNPILGSVPPGNFIPIAEKTGLINSIGDWVICTAIAQIKQWELANLNTGTVSINISAVQFNDNMLTERILEEIKESGITAPRLGIELTESVAMNLGSNILNIMEKLRRNNVPLSIDDFGTGYSSLSVLKKFNISKIKIDQSFVRDLATEENDTAIVKAIINMATSLGFSTIAEGVETREQADILKKLGCPEIQGYLISRPVPADQFAKMVRSYNNASISPALSLLSVQPKSLT